MTNFARLNQAMGLQRSSASSKQKVQPIAEVLIKNDENSGDLSLASITSDLHDISNPNKPIPSDLAYNSWVVRSFILSINYIIYKKSSSHLGLGSSV